MASPDLKPAQPLASEGRSSRVSPPQSSTTGERPQTYYRPVATEIPRGHGVFLLPEHHGGPERGLKVGGELPVSAKVFEGKIGARGR